MAELVMEGIAKRFGATVALADLTLNVGDGEFLVLLGPTGAGKTASSGRMPDGCCWRGAM